MIINSLYPSEEIYHQVEILRRLTDRGNLIKVRKLEKDKIKFNKKLKIK
jgi:hypothetical protein